MGLPAISSKGLPGRRLDPKRAGMTTLKGIKTSCLPTREEIRNRSAQFFVQGQRPGLLLQHDRDAVADGISKPVHPADQLAPFDGVLERPRAQGTTQNVAQFLTQSGAS